MLPGLWDLQKSPNGSSNGSVRSPKNAPLVSERFWDGLRWGKRRLQSTKSRTESFWDGLGPEFDTP